METVQLSSPLDRARVARHGEYLEYFTVVWNLLECVIGMAADAQQTQFCFYLSAILLGGLSMNALFGLWWADPAAALVMVPIIAREGVQSLRGEKCCH
jgi:hypothetical protein